MTSGFSSRVCGAFALVCAGLLFPHATHAQTACGTTGPDRVVSAPGTILNAYYPNPAGLTTVPVGSGLVPLDATARRGSGTIAAGDLVLIVQVQGARIDRRAEGTVNGRYGDGPGFDDRQGVLDEAQFVAGLYEFNVAAGPVAGGVLPLVNTTRNLYIGDDTADVGGNLGGGVYRYQVVRVPTFGDLLVTSAGAVTGEPWH